MCLSRLRVQLCIELYKSYCTVYTLTLFSFLDSPVGGWVELCPPTTTSLSGSCKVTNLARHPPCARSPRSGSLVYTSSHLPPLRRALPGCLARTASRGPRPRALCAPHTSHVVVPAVLLALFLSPLSPFPRAAHLALRRWSALAAASRLPACISAFCPSLERVHCNLCLAGSHWRAMCVCVQRAQSVRARPCSAEQGPKYLIRINI